MLQPLDLPTVAWVPRRGGFLPNPCDICQALAGVLGNPRHPQWHLAPELLPGFQISPRKHRPLLRFELSFPEAWLDILQSSACLGAPQRLSHKWVNQPHLEPMCVFLASVSLLTHTRCVRQPLECLNPRFRHSVVFLMGRSAAAFWGLHHRLCNGPILCRRICSKAG